MPTSQFIPNEETRKEFKLAGVYRSKSYSLNIIERAFSKEELAEMQVTIEPVKEGIISIFNVKALDNVAELREKQEQGVQITEDMAVYRPLGKISLNAI